MTFADIQTMQYENMCKLLGLQFLFFFFWKICKLNIENSVSLWQTNVKTW
jgi:hypothetical protein